MQHRAYAMAPVRQHVHAPLVTSRREVTRIHRDVKAHDVRLDSRRIQGNAVEHGQSQRESPGIVDVAS